MCGSSSRPLFQISPLISAILQAGTVSPEAVWLLATSFTHRKKLVCGLHFWEKKCPKRFWWVYVSLKKQTQKQSHLLQLTKTLMKSNLDNWIVSFSKIRLSRGNGCCVVHWYSVVSVGNTDQYTHACSTVNFVVLQSKTQAKCLCVEF